MRKQIDGKKFDTELSKKVGEAEANCSKLDHKYWKEELYRRKPGDYFLYGCGGPKTKYGRLTVGGYQSGEVIIPITDEEAKAWANEHLTTEQVKEIFEPKVARTANDTRLRKQSSITMLPETWEKLDKMAYILGTSRAQAAEQSINEAYKRFMKEEDK